MRPAPPTLPAPQANSPFNPFAAAPTATTALLLDNVVADLEGLLAQMPAEARALLEPWVVREPPQAPAGIAAADSLDCRRNVAATKVGGRVAGRASEPEEPELGCRRCTPAGAASPSLPGWECLVPSARLSCPAHPAAQVLANPCAAAPEVLLDLPTAGTQARASALQPQHGCPPGCPAVD